MPKTESSLAIVFADISRSTKLYELHGDVRAREIVAETLALLQAATVKHGGAVIKTIGDEIMATFPDPLGAAMAACEMHKLVTGDQKLAGLHISIKIGLHYGSVLLEDNDVWGDAVNVTARAVKFAKPEQIVTTGSTIRNLPREVRMNARHIGKVKVRGKSEEMDFFEIIWQDDPCNLTVKQTQDFDYQDLFPVKLVLSYAGREFVVDKDSPVAHIGRGEQNEIIASGRYVSRLHAKIEYRKGKFILVDHSTNGTHVHIQGEDGVCLHLDEAAVRGEGVISLGREPAHEDAEIVRFRLVTE